MKELNTVQLEEVNGGINPYLVIFAVGFVVGAISEL
jgi:lactobin A/cerein 7B family class IIb bacteriocin